VSSSYQELRGAVAAGVGCPTTAAGSRRFRGENPALFDATGVGDHPYPGNQNPVTDGTNDPDFAAFPDLGRLENVLDRVNRVYGSGRRYSIYNDEYGYITDPPSHSTVGGTNGGHYVSPATAAYYINWAEYLSWKEPRVASYMQYELIDPPPTAGPFYSGFASGLEFYDAKPKATYNAYRLPVYMPATSFSRNAAVEVWGDARPAPFMDSDRDGPQTVDIQLDGRTLRTVTVTGATGYFDIEMTFPGSGTVRLAWLPQGRRLPAAGRSRQDRLQPELRRHCQEVTAIAKWRLGGRSDATVGRDERQRCPPGGRGRRRLRRPAGRAGAAPRAGAGHAHRPAQLPSLSAADLPGGDRGAVAGRDRVSAAGDLQGRPQHPRAAGRGRRLRPAGP